MNSKIHNLSLQGFTGIFFGIFSVVFIGFIHTIINEYTSLSGMTSVLPISFFEFAIGILGVLFVLITYFVIVLVNRRRRKKRNLKGWNHNAKYIRFIFFIYFLILIVSTYLCVSNGVLKLIIPIVLLLYGLSCIIANGYTNGSTKILGLFFAIQSLLAFFFPEVQFLLLAISFGGFHIIYGILDYKN